MRYETLVNVGILMAIIIGQACARGRARSNDEGRIGGNSYQIEIPSCEELREGWKQSQRIFQEAATRHFQTSVYPQPLTYGTWKTESPRPRTIGYPRPEPVYGRVVHSPDEFIYRNRMRAQYPSYRTVARMVGAAPAIYTPFIPVTKPTYFRLEYPMRQPYYRPMKMSPAGRFQELRDILRMEQVKEMEMMRLKEGDRKPDVDNNYSKYNFPRDQEDDYDGKSSPPLYSEQDRKHLYPTGRKLQLTTIMPKKERITTPIPMSPQYIEAIQRQWAAGW